MHGVYNESLTLEKSVFIQGDRGPGSGVEISAPMNTECLSFDPKQPTAHAVVANVQFAAKINSSAPACVDVKQGVFTLKESDVPWLRHAPGGENLRRHGDAGEEPH